MEPAQFVTAPPVTIVAGKGGVGKTTVAATLALVASRAGLNALIVEIEGKSGLPALFGDDRLTYDELTLVPADSASKRGWVRARTLTPDEALLEYLRQNGMGRISRRLSESGAVDMVATATPGLKDVLILAKIKQLELSGDYDVVIVDAPAAGHAISFLRSPVGLIDAVSTGPIRSQAQGVIDMLSDPLRCQVLLVTLPEETPVNEVSETAYSLEDQVGIKLGPIVINGIYPELKGLTVDPKKAAATAETHLRPGEADRMRDVAEFRLKRRALQVEQIERLEKALPLAQIELPYLFACDIEAADLVHLATAFEDGVAPLEHLGGGR